MLFFINNSLTRLDSNAFEGMMRQVIRQIEKPSNETESNIIKRSNSRTTIANQIFNFDKSIVLLTTIVASGSLFEYLLMLIRSH